MAWANLLIALCGMITGVVATYFTYVTVREQVRRRRVVTAPEPPPEPPPVPAASSGSPDTYDAFVSYAAADTAHAVRLATRLRDHGMRVFLAEWIGAGLVADLEKERALLGSANGVLLFSRAALADQGLMDEYAALLMRVRSGGRRFIPVLVDPVTLPPFARIRVPVDLTGEGDAYEARIDSLVRALRGPEVEAGA